MVDSKSEELEWWHLSICRGMETSWFYEDYEADVVFALTMDGICFSCPVRSFCMVEGIKNQEYGLWGGIYFINGKMDEARNSHKTEGIWELIRSGISG